MDLESLRIFNTVAAELSITQAALKLGRAASNVTTRIQQLETDIGADLFIRTGKRIVLSVAGEIFLDYSERMLALEVEAKHVVTGGINGGTLHIGCMESTAASRLPPVLALYNKTFPSTQLKLDTGPSRTLMESVRNGKLDCAFVALPLGVDTQELSEIGLSVEKIWQEELILLLPASETEISDPKKLRTRSLATFKQGCTYRNIAENILGTVKNTDWTIQEMGSYHGMIACVSAGSCVTLLPQSVLDMTNGTEDLKKIRLQFVDTYLLWRTDYNTPAFQNFISQIRRI